MAVRRSAGQRLDAIHIDWTSQGAYRVAYRVNMTGRVAGRRVLVTSAGSYMGPPIVALMRAEGADLVTDDGDLLGADEPDELIERTGEIDVLVANLDLPASVASVCEINDREWRSGFDAMVDPLMRLVRAAAPSMIEREFGSIIAITSSSPLRRMRPHAISYVTARAAQNAFVRSAGHELASHNVRLNAIAQNFVENETYHPPSIPARM